MWGAPLTGTWFCNDRLLRVATGDVAFTPLGVVRLVGVVAEVTSLGRCVRNLRGASGAVNFIPAVKTLRGKRLRLMGHTMGRGSATVMDMFMGPARFGSGGSLTGCPHALTTSYGLLRDMNYGTIFSPSTGRFCSSRRLGSAFRFSFKNLSRMVRNGFHPNRFGKIMRIMDGLFGLIRPAQTCFNRGSFRRLTVVHHVIGVVGFGVRVVNYPVMHRRDKLTLSDHGTLLDSRRHGLTTCVRTILGRDAAFCSRAAIHRLRSTTVTTVGHHRKLRIRCFSVIGNSALRDVRC